MDQSNGIYFSLVVPKPPAGYRVSLSSKETKSDLESGLKIARTVAGRLGLGYQFRSDQVTEAESRRIVERISLDARHATNALADRFLAGELSRDEWYKRMRALIVPRFYAGIFSALGPALSEADRAWAQAEVRRQLGHLKKFRTEIGTGDQPLDGTIRMRSELYGAATWSAAQNSLLRRAMEQGKTEARRVLGIADHCRTTNHLIGCIEQAELGWQPIDRVKPIGVSPCRSRCHCHIDYR